jgi:GSCFA family.
MLGSCFADEVGKILNDYKFDIKINPFGTLYNPYSIANSIERLSSGKEFTKEDIIECLYGMRNGLPIKRYCSFYHHTSHSKESPQAFLDEANSRLAADALFFKNADTIIITLGTAWVFRHLKRNIIVSNCHKIPACEFSHELLNVQECTNILKQILFKSDINETLALKYPDKNFIFTISPIRHLKNGAHGNQISKSTLLLAIDELLSINKISNNIAYFPAYEIMMDELRDYRFYAADMIHPSDQAIEYIFDRFKHTFISPKEYSAMEDNLKKTKMLRHKELF